jgi:hypothetical protein
VGFWAKLQQRRGLQTGADWRRREEEEKRLEAERWRAALAAPIPQDDVPVRDEALREILAAERSPRQTVARRAEEGRRASHLAEAQVGVLLRCSVCGKPLTPASRGGKHRAC